MAAGIQVNIPEEAIVQFCQRWKIVEFALFGSVLRTDFREESDIDVLVTFEPAAPWSLFDFVQMQDELEAIFGRKVDLIERAGLRNPYRLESILDSMRVIYDAVGT